MSTNRISKIKPPLLTDRMSRWLGLMLVVAAIVIVFDFLTKWLVTREIGPGTSRSGIEIAGNFIKLRYSVNAGIAFGLLDGYSTLAGMLVGIVVMPLLIVLIALATHGPQWALASGLVLGGAAGNFIDRIGDQSVTDFVVVGRWPLFNMADAAITVGALMLIGLSFLGQRDDTGTDEVVS